MRNTLRLLVPCLLIIGACSHSGRTTTAATVPLRAVAMRQDAPTRVTAQAETLAYATTQPDEPTAQSPAGETAATRRSEEPAPATTRVDATATHSFAPTSHVARLDDVCGEAQVRFVTGSSVLDTGARRRLDAYAACVTNAAAQAVYISGTADAGSDARGMGLAGARARAVADYLHEGGLHMAFEVRTYRAGASGRVAAASQVARSATVTTVSPHSQTR